MATYKLGPGTQSAFLPAALWRPLICEACREALGIVRSLVRHEDISALLVTALWPEVQGAVKRNARECHGPAKQ